jgi:hypothetical protein
MTSGERFIEEVNPTPGSPARPWRLDDVATKFAQIERVGIGPSGVQRIRDEIERLPEAGNLHGLLEAVTIESPFGD